MFVRFKEDRYDFYSRLYSFGSEANRHNLLFSYVSKDISCLPPLLENYVSKGMDKSSFELTGYQYTENDALEIRNILLPLHDYYKADLVSNNFNTLVNAIGEYFNALLISASWQETEGKFKRFDPIYEKEWYCKRFDALTAPYLESIRKDNHKHPHFTFFEKYKSMVGDDLPDDWESVFFLPNGKRNEKGFAYEIQTHEFVKRILFWIFDLSAPYIHSLTVPQREWLYGNIYGALRKEYEMTIPRHLFLSIPYLYKHKKDNKHSQISMQINELSRPLEAIYEAYVNNKAISEESERSFKIAYNYAIQLDNSMVHEEYEITDLRQLLFLEILHMIQKEQQIKKCKNCGLYFIVNNRNQLYCNRLTDDGKTTCDEIGKKRSFQRKKEADPALNLYTKAYNTHRMRVKNRIGDWNKDKLNTWRLEAKTKLEMVRLGTLDIDKYSRWLKL